MAKRERNKVTQPREWGMYRDKRVIRARQLTERELINTNWGPTVGMPGGYEVLEDGGQTAYMEQEEFELYYAQLADDEKSRLAQGELEVVNGRYNEEILVPKTVGWNEYTVEELKEELRNRNLSTSGNKAELVARLERSDNAGQENAVDKES